jgi:hypothetical protein
MRRDGHVACVWELRDIHDILVGKSDWKRSLGKPVNRFNYDNNNYLDKLQFYQFIIHCLSCWKER